jgi:hypothetical protein
MLLALFCIRNDGCRANILGEIKENAKVVMVLLDFGRYIGRYILPIYSILGSIHHVHACKGNKPLHRVLHRLQFHLVRNKCWQ